MESGHVEKGKKQTTHVTLLTYVIPNIFSLCQGVVGLIITPTSENPKILEKAMYVNKPTVKLSGTIMQTILTIRAT